MGRKPIGKRAMTAAERQRRRRSRLRKAKRGQPGRLRASAKPRGAATGGIILPEGSPQDQNPKPPPPGWGKDKLSEFLELARGNEFATFHNKRAEYGLLCEIDACYLRLADNLVNTKDMVPAILFYRSHAAYRAGCRTSMAGQAPETFVLLRSCLEYAGYALMIHRTPGLAETWLRRNDDEKTMRAMRTAFFASKVVETIQSAEKRLAEVYVQMYERAIDFGAHPNQRAVTGSMKLEETPEARHYQQVYLHGDGVPLLHGLKSTAQSGLCALHIFQYVFPARFAILRIRERLIKLRNSGV